jgi:hypothetical protein
MEKEGKRGSSKEEIIRTVERLLARDLPRSNILSFQPVNISMFRLPKRRKLAERPIFSSHKAQETQSRPNGVPTNVDLYNGHRSEVLDTSALNSGQQMDQSNNSFVSEGIHQLWPSNNTRDYFNEIPETIEFASDIFITYFLHAMEIERLVLVNKELTAEAHTMDKEMTALEDELEALRTGREAEDSLGHRHIVVDHNENVDGRKNADPRLWEGKTSEATDLTNKQILHERSLKEASMKFEGEFPGREETLLRELKEERLKCKELSNLNELLMKKAIYISSEHHEERRRTVEAIEKKSPGTIYMVDSCETHQIKRTASSLRPLPALKLLPSQAKAFELESAPSRRSGLLEQTELREGLEGDSEAGGDPGCRSRWAKEAIERDRGRGAIHSGRLPIAKEYGSGGLTGHQYSQTKDSQVTKPPNVGSSMYLSFRRNEVRLSSEGYTPLSSTNRVKYDKIIKEQQRQEKTGKVDEEEATEQGTLRGLAADSNRRNGSESIPFGKKLPIYTEMAGKMASVYNIYKLNNDKYRPILSRPEGSHSILSKGLTDR